MTQTSRSLVLDEASRLTTQERNATYGDPGPNFRLAAELKRTFAQYKVREIGPAEQEAIDMILTKLSRIGAGVIHRDNYVDGAAYFGIAYENALFDSGREDLLLKKEEKGLTSLGIKISSA